MKRYLVLLSAPIVLIAAGAASSQATRDYQRLSGKWQLTRAYVNGRPLPSGQVSRTLLITDGNRFWLPGSSGAGTHAAGTFTIDPSATPKRVDSTAKGGRGAGAVTRGIYVRLDATHQRECWGAPGGARPPSFTPHTCRILQYWKKIGPVPHGY
jgi:uncharacterized protein (TIGR03067 family)